MKKDRLKKKLFESAWQIVDTEGLEKLNIRKLAKMSSCSVGSVYNAFGNFQELHLSLNAKILSSLYDSLNRALEKGINEKNSLREVFLSMGLAYIEFGQNNLFLWKSLFESLPFETTPDWYVAHTRRGIDQICERLSKSFSLTQDQTKQILGFFWASIHGVSAIFLNKKMKMVSELFNPNSLEAYINYCLDGLFQEASNAKLVSS